MALRHFLLIYNLRQRHLEHLEEFGTDTRAATHAYAELEREYRKRDDHADFEIVLVGADSLETVRGTHSRYFDDEGIALPTFAVPS
jgi:hypothetical protein